jgi:hypothetical protein
MDTYGINCNYRVYKKNDIISCNSHSGAGVPHSVQRQGYGLQIRGWNPGMGKRFFVSPKYSDRMYSEKISLDLEEEKGLGMQLGC